MGTVIMGFWYNLSLWLTQLCIGLFTTAYGIHLVIEGSRESSLTQTGDEKDG